MFKKAKENKKGFTLAELLIVVAIIAVLVAISIPIFTSQLEKSRESTDAANLRAAYAEVMACALTGDVESGTGVTKGGSEGSLTFSKEVTLKQAQAGWQNSEIKEIGGVEIANITATPNKKVTVTYTQSTGKVTFTTEG